jgi:xylose isomerase
MKFAIEYKPREPRVSMFFSSAAKTLLAIEDMDVPNVGILFDFGHSLYGGESPAEAGRLIHSRGLLYAIDVNDNFRGWDDDLVVGSVHLVETLEFFYTLREGGWDGVWQLDQFPFREDSVEAARAGIETMRSIHRALDLLDVAALRQAQDRQDALAANRIARQAIMSCQLPPAAYSAHIPRRGSQAAADRGRAEPVSGTSVPAAASGQRDRCCPYRRHPAAWGIHRP